MNFAHARVAQKSLYLLLAIFVTLLFTAAGVKWGFLISFWDFIRHFANCRHYS